MVTMLNLGQMPDIPNNIHATVNEVDCDDNLESQSDNSLSFNSTPLQNVIKGIYNVSDQVPGMVEMCNLSKHKSSTIRGQGLFQWKMIQVFQ